MDDFSRAHTSSPARGAHPAPKQGRTGRTLRRIIFGVLLGFALLMAIGAAATSGIFGVAVILGLTLLASGVLTMLLGRRLWRMAAPGRAGSVLAGAGLVMVVLGAAFAPAAAPDLNSAASPEAAAGQVISTPSAGSASMSTNPTTDIAVSAVDVDAIIAAARPQTALAVLGGLTVSDGVVPPGDARNQFGPVWADVDRNGCDTRNDILARDLTGVVLQPGTNDCVVTGGRLTDPYLGGTAVVDAGTVGQGVVEIDHVVSLSNAWASGARGWDPQQRQRFANDPLELLAVSADGQKSKGDNDASGWLPANPSYRCEFIARQVAIKAKYRLTVGPAERAAQAEALSVCPQQAPPVDTAAVEASALSRASAQSRADAASAAAAKQSQQSAASAAAKQSQAAAAAAAAKSSQAAAADASRQAAAAAAEQARASAAAAAARAAAAAAAASQEAAATPTQAPNPDTSVFWANCTAAYDAGVSHILRGEPGYRPELDGNSDGDAGEGP